MTCKDLAAALSGMVLLLGQVHAETVRSRAQVESIVQEL
jgi:hypothetical protein